MKRFCAKCGKEFDATSAAVRYCDECKAEVKKEWTEKQKKYAKQRADRLGLVNITIYKTDRDRLKALAASEDTTVAEIVKKLAANITEPTKDEPKEEKPTKKAEKATKKA